MSRSETVPSLIFLKLFLNVCTARSASPFDAGWYGAVLTCRIPLAIRKASNSSLMEHGLLSVTTVFVSPKRANVVRNC